MVLNSAPFEVRPLMSETYACRRRIAWRREPAGDVRVVAASGCHDQLEADSVQLARIAGMLPAGNEWSSTLFARRELARQSLRVDARHRVAMDRRSGNRSLVVRHEFFPISAAGRRVVEPSTRRTESNRILLLAPLLSIRFEILRRRVAWR